MRITKKRMLQHFNRVRPENKGNNFFMIVEVIEIYKKEEK